MRLSGEAGAVPMAREAVQELRAELEQTCSANLSLLVSELVTNSIRYAYTPDAASVELRARVFADRVRKGEVTDRPGFEPRPQHAGSPQPVGLGPLPRGPALRSLGSTVGATAAPGSRSTASAARGRSSLLAAHSAGAGGLGYRQCWTLTTCVLSPLAPDPPRDVERLATGPATVGRPQTAASSNLVGDLQAPSCWRRRRDQARRKDVYFCGSSPSALWEQRGGRLDGSPARPLGRLFDVVDEYLKEEGSR